MSYQQAVTARLLTALGAVVAGDPLINAFDIDFVAERNGPGNGSISISLSEAGAAQLLPGRYVDCMCDGVSRFTFKIEGNPSFTVIAQGEEHDQIMNVSGRGWASIMDEAIIYPEVDLDLPLDTTNRLWSFASPSFPNEAAVEAPWAPAVNLYEYLDGANPPNNTLRGRYQIIPTATDPAGSPYPSPVNFPWPMSPDNYDYVSPPGVGYSETYWIWSESGASTDEYGIGWCFFRNTLTIGAEAVVTFNVTGDNFFTFFLEGVPILGEDADHYIWQGWKPIPIVLPAGAYTVAAFVENVPTGLPGEGVNQNPGGFLATITANNSDNVPTSAYLVTDTSWDCVFIPSTSKWPGWTPGQIVASIRTEAYARGCMAVYNSSTFTDSLDSDGLAWRPLDGAAPNSPYVSSFSVEVGTTMMAALNLLVEQGWISWYVRPGTWVLDITRGLLPAVPTSSASYSYQTNITGLERRATAPYANALLVQWSNGYEVVQDPGAITAYGTRVEDTFSSDATSASDAKQAGRTELLRRVQTGWPAIILSIEPTSAADCPFLAYEPGDYVSVPSAANIAVLETVKVYSIRCRQDAEGWATWTLELNARIDIPERRRADLMRQIGGKTQTVRGNVS